MTKFNCEPPVACKPAVIGCEPFGYPFQKIRVSPTLRFDTRIEWQLAGNFVEPGPYSFQLETALHDVATATDWQPVGSAVNDAAFLVDDSRQHNAHHRRHYRIRLQTSIAEYASRPVFWQGMFSRNNYLRAKQILRNYDKQFRNLQLGVHFSLLKRKITGEACPRCSDFQIKQSTDINCPVCYGTGITGGYWRSEECLFAQLSPDQQHVEDTDDENGMNNPQLIRSGRFMATPTLDTLDVVVIKNSDMRYVIRSHKVALEFDAVPVVYGPVVLVALPFTSIIYQYPVT